MTETPDDEAFDEVMNQIQTAEGEEAWAEVMAENEDDPSVWDVLDWMAMNLDGVAAYVASKAYLRGMQAEAELRKKEANS